MYRAALRFLLRPSRSSGDRGQVVVIVTAALVAVLAILALVFDAANAYVVRRQLQAATDAASLAAANLIQTATTGSCSAIYGGSEPYPEIVAAARASVAENLPDYPPSEVEVTCPSDARWLNYAVKVELTTTAPRFFSVIWSRDDLSVRTDATAINGHLTHRNYSVITLNPAYQQPAHPQARNGCPSVLFSGGPTVIMESAMHIDSGCLAGDGGALGTNGVAATLTMRSGAPIEIVGEYYPGALRITPPPATGQPAIGDPLETAGPPSYSISATAANEGWFSLPTRAAVNENCNGCWVRLEPGIYDGGIRLGGQAKAVMAPGVYVMRGGGMDLGAQTSLYSALSNASSPTPSSWGSDCPAPGCGVLIFNTCNGPNWATTCAGGTLGSITINAGATVKLRSLAAYEGVLFWQNKNREPSNSYSQPVVTLSGGGNVDISGTVYAPSAKIFLRGGAGGSGGIVELKMRFISYDLQFNGNSTFHFIYVADETDAPMDYGLVE